MMDSRVQTREDNLLYVVAGEKGSYQSIRLGKNVYDADENGLIVLYNENEREIRRYTGSELIKEISNCNRVRLSGKTQYADRRM